MTGPQVVIDTNVFVAALRSQLGAAYHLLTQLGTSKFEMNLSVPLVLEYEDVAKRQADELGLSDRDIADIIDYFCSIGVPHKIYYLWRPFLEDAKDDMVLEVAVAGQCAYIVTYNERHFRGVGQFGLKVVTPQKLLREIGALS